MSHVTSIAIEIRDLRALENACIELGCKFIPGQKTYKWYGKIVGEAPIPEGFTVEELGKCDHAIRVPGEEYEIGVVKKNGTYRLLFDSWNTKTLKYDNGINTLLGDRLQRLTQVYGVHKATIEARTRGYQVARSLLPNGAIKLTIGGIA